MIKQWTGQAQWQYLTDNAKPTLLIGLMVVFNSIHSSIDQFSLPTWLDVGMLLSILIISMLAIIMIAKNTTAGSPSKSITATYTDEFTKELHLNACQFAFFGFFIVFLFQYFFGNLLFSWVVVKHMGMFNLGVGITLYNARILWQLWQDKRQAAEVELLQK